MSNQIKLCILIYMYKVNLALNNQQLLLNTPYTIIKPNLFADILYMICM